MKLLIVTQKVDKNDPILGFFHRWLEEFAKHYDAVEVICQYEGEYALPENVSVYSLGKEKGRWTWLQVLTFWMLQFKLSKVDRVLVHMTPIWVVLGGLYWKLKKIPMYLWYEARGTRWPLRVALKLVNKVFSASAYGMPLETEKSVVCGHGIDTQQFAPSDEPFEKGHIVTVGRITPAKNLDAIIDQFLFLQENVRLTIVGAPLTISDEAYALDLKEKIQKNGVVDSIAITSMNQSQLIELLQSAHVLVHASDTGLDKAVLEAMAVGCPVVSSGQAFLQVLPLACRSKRAELAQGIKRMLALSPEERSALAQEQRSIIEQQHGLQRLIEKLAAEMN